MSNLINSWWPEKYRPKNLEEYVGDPEFKDKIKRWIEEDEINHLLFYSEKPGTGKTTCAKMIAGSLDADILYINASAENNIDTVREKITNFVSTIGFKKWKIVIADECLNRDTLVTVMRAGRAADIKISEVDVENDLIKSFNTKTAEIEWQPFEFKDVGYRDDMYRITLENGKDVECTSNHKWYVMDDDLLKIVRTDELHIYEHIISPV